MLLMKCNGTRMARGCSASGAKFQRATYRAVAGDLKLAYAQFEELETFARFGARLDDDTRQIIEHGNASAPVSSSRSLRPSPSPRRLGQPQKRWRKSSPSCHADTTN